MGDDTFTAAFQLHVSGFHVIPSGGGESGKQPLVEWTEYQTRQPTDEELFEWRDHYSPKLWGIVCNSSVAVLDADSENVRLELEAEMGNCHVITPRGGGHWYINTTGSPFPTKTGVLPSIDVRGVGGFVNICGSSALGEYRIVTPPSQDTLIPCDRIPGRILKSLNGHKQRPGTAEPITEGQRNATLTSIAGLWRREGMEEPEIAEGLLRINARRCQPPLPESKVLKIATSIARYPPNNSGSIKSISPLSKDRPADTARYKNVTESVTESEDSLARRIEEWVRQTSGYFEVSELDRELGLATVAERANRRVILHRLRDNGKIALHPRYNKMLRYITADARAIDFKRAGKRTPLDIGFPFGIQKLCHVYPGNLVVLAGAQNAGKTAFLLNVIRLNMHWMPVYYVSSEMGAEELAMRLEKFPGIGLEDWIFTAWERSSDFADVIVPDAINIIDYYEFAGGEAFYQISEGLRAIWEKVGTGIAIVAIQKGANRTTGRGGDFGLEKPRLYLGMDAGKLTIVKGKNWADPQSNPNSLVTEFKLTDGCNFIVTRDWYRPSTEGVV